MIDIYFLVKDKKIIDYFTSVEKAVRKYNALKYFLSGISLEKQKQKF